MVACCWLWSGPAAAGLAEWLGMDQRRSEENPFLRVEQAFRINSKQHDNELVIQVDIAPGYYLYRHRISVTAAGAELGHWQLPEGTPHEDEYFGQSQVFYRSLQLPLSLANIGPDASITFAYQGCTSGLCYPPERHRIELDTDASR